MGLVQVTLEVFSSLMLEVPCPQILQQTAHRGGGCAPSQGQEEATAPSPVLPLPLRDHSGGTHHISQVLLGKARERCSTSMGSFRGAASPRDLQSAIQELRGAGMGTADICNCFSRRRIEDSPNREAPALRGRDAVCEAADRELQ